MKMFKNRKDTASAPYPTNKREGELLRRLMSTNNMSEREIRSIEKYKIMLHEAARPVGSIDSLWDNKEAREKLALKRLARRFAVILGVPVYHSSVIKNVKEYVDANFYLTPAEIKKDNPFSWPEDSELGDLPCGGNIYNRIR